MAAEKTNALVLKILHYRETSCIFHLFTERHGLVHGIAKGIRRLKKGISDCPDRGYQVECTVYLKAHRDLQTLGAIHTLDFYPSIRSSIVKTALRDAALETVSSAITESDVHPELYIFFIRFLNYLQTATESECNPFALLLFYHRFAARMGFGLDCTRCGCCGAMLDHGAVLMAAKGALHCIACADAPDPSSHIPGPLISYLCRGVPKPGALRALVAPAALKSATHAFADYCRYHFDIKGEYKALVFLEGMGE
jgi:DNA repair protein RecO